MRTNFITPKKRKCVTFRFRVAPGADANQKKAAQARADGIVKEARGGKDFSQLAKLESNDPSAAKGGDLGWVAAGANAAADRKSNFRSEKGRRQ